MSQPKRIDDHLYAYKNTKGKSLYLVRYKDVYRRGFTNLKSASEFLEDLESGVADKFTKINKYETRNKVVMLFDVMDAYVQTQKESDNRRGTYIKAERVINNILKPNFPNKNIRSIEPEDCSEFKKTLDTLTYEKRIKGGNTEVVKYSTTSKNDFMNRLSMIFKFAAKFGLRDNPMEGIRPFKETKEENDAKTDKEKEMWTYDEFNHFLSQLEMDEGIMSPYYGYYKTLGASGIRKEECGALRYDDIRFETKEITIDESLTNKNESHSWELCLVKRPASRRIVPIPDSLLEHLKMRYERDKVKKGFSDKWFIFHQLNDGTKFINPNHVDDHKRDVLTKIGLQWNTNHQMRHMYTNRLRYAGIHEYDIAVVTGHETNLNKSNEIYYHVSKQSADQIRELMEEVMCKNSAK